MKNLVAILCLSLGLSPAMLPAAEGTATVPAAKPYPPLDYCIVSGDKLDKDKPITVVKDGQEYKLCCKDCIAELNNDLKKFQAKLADAQKKNADGKPADAPMSGMRDDHSDHPKK